MSKSSCADWICFRIFASLTTLYGDDSLKKTAVYEWSSSNSVHLEILKAIAAGEDLQSPETKVEQVKQLIRSDRRMTIDELTQEVGSHGSIHSILSDDLKIKRVGPKLLPRLLNPDQMETRQLTAAECCEKAHKTRHLRQSLQVTRPECTLTTRRQRCSHRMAHNVLSSTKKITPCQIQKNCAHCVFRQRRCGAP
ncbi:hypothetical protein AVEN_253828-1 [Araneus ventricosus]|uniref:Mos1 transposase HTH domain-containing protein n=1 Tax=Araneus ventricosus TaxID=182803 RepID=A0A4Y2TSX4_ARAVE|nr:hypothetical protein AVEN_253828-1 [Araneus ventricosus]